MDNAQNFIDLVKKRNIEVDESQFNQFCKDVKNAFQRSLTENDDSYLQNYYDKFQKENAELFSIVEKIDAQLNNDDKYYIETKWRKL